MRRWSRPWTTASAGCAPSTPTAAALAGAKLPNGTDGVDLMPYLTGRNAGVPNPTLFWRAGPNFAIRDGNNKMWDVDRADPKDTASVGAEVTPDGTKHQEGSPFGRYVMLYDLKTDQGETKNLSAARPDLVAALRAKIAAWDKGNIAPQWTSMRQSVRKQDGQLIKLYD